MVKAVDQDPITGTSLTNRLTASLKTKTNQLLNLRM